MVNALNSIKLHEEDLFEAIHAATDAYEKGECHLMTGVIPTMQLFITAPDKAKAVIFRLQALGLMMENDEINNWIQLDGARALSATLQSAMIAAAAEHPLSLIDGDISFEKESFFRRVFELAEPQGIL